MTPAQPLAPSRARVLVLGYVVRGPLGGLAWHHLQYVLGLVRAGYDAWFVEDSDDYPGCYDPTTYACGTDPAYGLAFAAAAFARLGLADRWLYHDAHAGRWHGARAADADALCRSADLVLDVSGVNPMRPWLRAVPARALVDTDPAFTQIRHLTDPDARARAAEHTAFFTFGENAGRPGCIVPDDGFPWRPTRQPVVLDAWPVTPAPARGRYTTVMQWESYPACEYGGRRYGMKAEAFGSYADLPRRTPHPLELALGSASAPRAALRAAGWHVRDPGPLSRDPWTYQRYLARSRGEFAVAKHGYVASRSGWFSERSAAYLASGRPVVVQDTGFTDWLPAGAGVLAFSTPDEALAALDEAEGRHAFHARAARDLAAACFDARVVLPRLVDEALGSLPTAPRRSPDARPLLALPPAPPAR